MAYNFSKLILPLCGLLLSGCMAAPWSPHETKAAKPASTADAIKAEAASKTGGTSEGQSLQQVMAELQQLGALDPQAQETLMADLRQTNPALWPAMVQQFRTAAAYRRQLLQREKQTAEAPRASEVAASQPAGPLPGSMPAAHYPPAEAACANPQPSTARGPNDWPVGQSPPPLQQPESVAMGRPVSTAVEPVTPSPVALASIDPPGGVRRVVEPSATPPASAGPVTRTSYDEPAGRDWRQLLAQATSAMEAEGKAGAGSETDAARQARLKMLYLLAGRRDDALRPVPDMSPKMQDYWSKQLYGLSIWLDSPKSKDEPRRAAEAKQTISDAIDVLGETSPLAVRNLNFCTAVTGFGSIRPFAKLEFRPNEEVLLYSEIDNFKAESTPKGFHTALKGSYQIFDGQGHRVVEQEFPAIEEYCQSRRRDFFVVFRLRMPKRIYSGKHSLQLTVEDVKSKKVGQSKIDFTVKGEE